MNEIAMHFKVGITFFEESLPYRHELLGACELLGLDPLYLANEGKLIAIVDKNDAEKVLQVMRSNKYGKQAVLIGTVTENNAGKVIMKTTIGGSRIVDMLTGEQLPRIC